MNTLYSLEVDATLYHADLRLTRASKASFCKKSFTQGSLYAKSKAYNLHDIGRYG